MFLCLQLLGAHRGINWTIEASCGARLCSRPGLRGAQTWTTAQRLKEDSLLAALPHLSALALQAAHSFLLPLQEERKADKLARHHDTETNPGKAANRWDSYIPNKTMAYIVIELYCCLPWHAFLQLSSKKGGSRSW